MNSILDYLLNLKDEKGITTAVSTAAELTNALEMLGKAGDERERRAVELLLSPIRLALTEIIESDSPEDQSQFIKALTGTGNRAKTRGDLPTDTQFTKIRALSRLLRIDPEAESELLLGCPVRELSRKAADSFIEHLTAVSLSSRLT